jgi:uncharacterized Zn finger protein
MRTLPIPPKIDNRPQESSGSIKDLFCKTCNKQLTLRDVDMSKYGEGIVKCKTCGSVVLDNVQHKKKKEILK